MLKTVEGCEEGDLSRRGKPSCKGILVSQQLLKTVDDLIVEKYSEGEQTLASQPPSIHWCSSDCQQGKANLHTYDEETTKPEAGG